MHDFTPAIASPRAILATPLAGANGAVPMINGAFVIYRRVPRGFARAAKPPRFRHPTFASAEAEAKRLQALHPESTFVILQEVALVASSGPAQSERVQ